MNEGRCSPGPGLGASLSEKGCAPQQAHLFMQFILENSLTPFIGRNAIVLAVSDSETKHPTAILRLNPTKET